MKSGRRRGIGWWRARVFPLGLVMAVLGAGLAASVSGYVFYVVRRLADTTYSGQDQPGIATTTESRSLAGAQRTNLIGIAWFHCRNDDP